MLLTPPWKILLFTDGLIEGRAAPGSSRGWGWEGLLDELAGGALAAGDDELLARLVAAAETANGEPLPDDVAAILLSPRS